MTFQSWEVEDMRIGLAELSQQLHDTEREFMLAQSKLRTILRIIDRWETDNRRHTTEAMEDIIIVLAAMGGVG